MNKYKLIIFYNVIAAVCFILTGCSGITSLRNPNGSNLISQTWNLPISDTSKIFIREGESYVLKLPDDSLIIRTDTIQYLKPDNRLYENIFGRIDQIVINTRNKEVKELYRFENGKVFLAGYVSPDTLNRYTKLDPPIVIAPEQELKIDSTISSMVKLKDEKATNEKGIKVKSVIKLKKKGELFINGGKEDCYLYELIITQDAIVNYGEQGLIVPEAILMQSNLLYGHKSGLIAEWGIRSRQKPEESITGQPEREIYIELNKYYKKNKDGKTK